VKNIKIVSFTGILLALALAGCFNPISMETPKPEGGYALSTDPFSIDIMVGQNGQLRSVASPGSARIKGDIRNIIQLIVVDNDAKEIIAFDEVRRGNDSSGQAILEIDSLPLGRTYSFLLLMGHWERDYAKEAKNGNGNYVYQENNPPTLLATGLKEQLIKESGKVTVTMWPMVVDTKFMTTHTGVPGGLKTREAAVKDGKPEKALLLPVGWTVNWTVQRGTFNDGFSNLIKAQKAIDSAAGDELLVKSKSSIVRGTNLKDLTGEEPTVTGHVVSLPIKSEYVSGIRRAGTEGSVNFKLEYIPFNQQEGKKWTAYKGESAFDLDGKAPIWIIRNGVNDMAQDSETDFGSFGKKAKVNVNGNGAVSYRVAAATGPSDKELPGYTETLTLKNGTFKGPSDSRTPKIMFTSEGYSGTAEGYYAVTGHNDPAPEYSAYTGSLGDLKAGDQEKEITLPTVGGKYYVYVVLFKDGNISNKLKYDTTSGKVQIEFDWGEEASAVGIEPKWGSDGA
jgi:hypothetical protein